MGRPPLFHTRTHINLPAEDLARIDAIVGQKGRSKFIRQAVQQMLGRLDPTPDELGPDVFEHDGGHEPRLSAAGTAALLEVIRKQGFDQVMRTLDYSDPKAFLHLLLGHSELTNRTVTLVAGLLIHHR